MSREAPTLSTVIALTMPWVVWHSKIRIAVLTAAVFAALC